MQIPRFLLLTLAAATISALSPAWAGLIPGASVYEAVNSNYPFRADTTASVSTSLPGGVVSLNLNDGADAVATGTAGFGVLHLVETVHAYSDGITTQQSTATVSTTWQDVLSVNTSAAAADLFLAGGFWVHGAASPIAGPYNLATTNFRWDFYASDARNLNYTRLGGQRVTRSNGFDEGTDFFTSSDPRGVFIPLLFRLYRSFSGNGYETDFSLTLAAGASASTTFPGRVDSATTTLDLGNTVLWGGLSIVDGDGNPVDGSLSSSSGFDWAAEQTETPEPVSFGLAAAGLTLLTLAGKRRLVTS